MSNLIPAEFIRSKSREKNAREREVERRNEQESHIWRHKMDILWKKYTCRNGNYTCTIKEKLLG